MTWKTRRCRAQTPVPPPHHQKTHVILSKRSAPKDPFPLALPLGELSAKLTERAAHGPMTTSARSPIPPPHPVPQCRAGGLLPTCCTDSITVSSQKADSSTPHLRCCAQNDMEDRYMPRPDPGSSTAPSKNACHPERNASGAEGSVSPIPPSHHQRSGFFDSASSMLRSE